MMLDLATSLQSTLVLGSLLSDYTLAFDYWILSTALPWATSWDAPNATRRWRTTVYACLAYAILEPLWYWLMTSVSDVAMWWLLMGCYLHIAAGPAGCLHLLSEAVLERKANHEEKCVGARDEQDLGEYRDEKKEDTSMHDNARNTPDVEAGERPAGLPTQTPDQNDFKRCLNHSMPWSFRLAPLLPIFTASASNAGLLYFTRFLSSEDSIEWQKGFKFGWCMIAGLCVFCLLFSKWAARWMFTFVSQNRTLQLQASGKGGSVWQESFRVVASLVMLVAVRAGMRFLLGQDVMAIWTVDTMPSGQTLALESHLHIGRFASEPADKSEFRVHWFDRIMAKIPWWAGIVGCILNLIGTALMVWQKRRQRHRG